MKERIEKYKSQFPKAFLLDRNEPEELAQYLRQQGWLGHEEQLLKVEKAGDGNMNYVLRAFTEQRSFIVKQSRPWVEKFPQIEAPIDRAIVEGQFYQLIQLNESLNRFTPAITGMDMHSNVIVLEDLGNSSDYTFLYKKGEQIDEKELTILTEIVSTLHHKYNVNTTKERIYNRSMRKLNHEHLFIFPLLEDNGFDLDTIQPGLQKLAMKYKTDTAYQEKVKALGEVYLEDGDTLLHGDYYPGSWLRTTNGPMLIDPEFCFFGPKEFDLSVFIAHLRLAQQPEKYINLIMDHYMRYNEVDNRLLMQLTGVEIMRRLIGLAQLPVDLELAEKEALLEEAYEYIMQ